MTRIGVVGAGTAGLAAAALFARAGHDVGVHRGALFTALRGAAERAGATILGGVEVVRRQDRTLIDAVGARYGPYAQGANLSLMDAGALADAGSLDAYEAARRAQSHFYGFGARALNAMFQNDHDAYAWPRDHLMATVSRLPWFRRRAMEVLAGTAKGPFTSIRM